MQTKRLNGNKFVHAPREKFGIDTHTTGVGPAPTMDDSSPDPATSAPFFECVLTGDKLFSVAHPHALIEDGLAYRVTGSTERGLATLALDASFTFTADGALPATVVDIVRWANMRPLQLDKPGFIKLWQRYLAALQRRLEATPEAEGGGCAASEQLLLRAHEFARKLLRSFDELEFLTGASEDASGPLGILHYLDDQPLVPQIYFLAVGARQRPATVFQRTKPDVIDNDER